MDEDVEAQQEEGEVVENTDVVVVEETEEDTTVVLDNNDNETDTVTPVSSADTPSELDNRLRRLLR